MRAGVHTVWHLPPKRKPNASAASAPSHAGRSPRCRAHAGAGARALQPVVRQNVYRPDFRGSFSIKDVLTPLVPELTYNDLVIVKGLVASVEIARLLFVA